MPTDEIPEGLQVREGSDGTVCRAGWALLRLFKPAQERFGEEKTRPDYRMVDEVIDYAFKLSKEKPKSRPLTETIKELEESGHKDSLDRQRLNLISNHLQRWIDYDLEKRTKKGIETTDATHIMAPPTWPSHGQIKHWIKTLKGIENPVEVTVDDLIKRFNQAGEVWDGISQIECLSTEQETQFEELAKTLVGVKIVDTN